jgi:MFS superfamily sulfate permease-like transporter
MSGWKRWLPGLRVLGQYEAAWLPRDLMAGLVLTTMLVPVGIAYAVGAVAVALLLVLAPNLLESLPSSALAAVVITAAIGLFEFADLRRIFRIQRWEFWLSVVCLAGVTAFGVIPGIGLAIVIAVIEFLWDGWRPHHAVLGRVDGIRGYHDLKRYPDARLIPGLVLFRWDAPLFFANAELFHHRVLEAAASSPTPVRRIIVAAEPVTSIDVTSADMLAELEHGLRESASSSGSPR